MSKFDYSNTDDHKFYQFGVKVVPAIARMSFKYKVTGTENFPKEGPYIIASNHIYVMDPGFVAMICDRPVHFMTKKEAFEKGIFSKILTGANAFPVNRGGAAGDSIAYAVKLLQEGKILGIFPEGHRSDDGRPAKARPGIAKIIKEAKVDVVPVSIFNDEGCKKGSKLSIRVGKPIKFEEFGLTDESGREEMRSAADFVMQKITALWEEGHCE